jgi:hypothetical protein
VTPQQRGSQLNYLLADVLRAYEIQARVSQPTDLGEIDVAFRLGETRIILEAKWTTDPIGFGAVSLLATRARQRLEGTIGVFASMAGYTPPALDQVSRSGERVRVVLFDGEHVEALIGGLAAPHELIDAALGEASVTGRTYVGVTGLLASHDRPAEPPIGFGPPEGYNQQLVGYAAEGLVAEIVVHCPEDIRGITVKPDGRLLATLRAGMVEVDLKARSARWVQGLTCIDRNPHIDPAGQIWVLRGAAVARLDGSRLRVLAGGFGGASTLFAGPSGTPWVLDRRAQPSAHTTAAPSWCASTINWATRSAGRCGCLRLLPGTRRRSAPIASSFSDLASRLEWISTTFRQRSGSIRRSPTRRG